MKAASPHPSGSRSAPALVAVSLVCVAAAALGRSPVAAADPPWPRGMPDSVSADLNIPAYRLTVRAGDSIVGEFPVAVGARAFPTPIGAFTLRKVELNPGWVPPASDWARDRQPMPPGPRNPMGRAKLEFLPTYYLHGTPEPESVGSPASHGCVRLRNADALALVRLLVGWGRPELADSVEGWAAGSAARRIDLERAAALTVHYDLLEVRHGRVVAYPDPYGLRNDSTEAAAAARLSDALGARVPRDMVARLLDRARRGPIDFPLDSIAGG